MLKFPAKKRPVYTAQLVQMYAPPLICMWQTGILESPCILLSLLNTGEDRLPLRMNIADLEM